jgi:hypothetical protein
MKMKWIILTVLFVGCRENEHKTGDGPVGGGNLEQSGDEDLLKIDSDISMTLVTHLKKEVTMREFLVASELCDSEEEDEEVLGLVSFEDTEGGVNSYRLNAGGGIRFTTNYVANGRVAEDAVYSNHVLSDVITSYEFFVNGEQYLYTLSEGRYARQ